MDSVSHLSKAAREVGRVIDVVVRRVSNERLVALSMLLEQDTAGMIGIMCSFLHTYMQVESLSCPYMCVVCVCTRLAAR